MNKLKFEIILYNNSSFTFHILLFFSGKEAIWSIAFVKSLTNPIDVKFLYISLFKKLEIASKYSLYLSSVIDFRNKSSSS